MHPDDVRRRAEQAMAAPSPVARSSTIEYRLRHADGHWEWVETTARASATEIQCSTREITELHHRLAQQSAVARLGDIVMQRAGPRRGVRGATRAVAETLDVDLVTSPRTSAAGA